MDLNMDGKHENVCTDSYDHSEKIKNSDWVIMMKEEQMNGM